MSPALIAHQSAALLRPMTLRRNRRRHTAARAAFRRVTLATLAAGALTLAASALTLAASALDRWTTESTDRSVANVARWTTTGARPGWKETYSREIGRFETRPEAQAAGRAWVRSKTAETTLTRRP